MTRAVIFANGEIRDTKRLRSIIREDDVLIAADGGLRYILSIGFQPSFLVGDLDSVTPADLKQVKEAGVEIRQSPVDKNETDLQLAMDLAVEMGFSDILITAAIGGRLDQTLGNIFLLGRDAYSGVSIRMDDGVEEVFLIRDKTLICGAPGEVVSLLPLGGPAHNVVTDGLKYPLQSETLFPDQTRGISNVMLDSSARVSLSQGVLICIHSRHITG